MISQTMPVLLKVFTDISSIDNAQSVEIQALICKIFYSTLSVRKVFIVVFLCAKDVCRLEYLLICSKEMFSYHGFSY